MSMFCLYVKASKFNRGTPLMTIMRMGPEWSGRRLRLIDAEHLELGEPELVGWSDFYGGSACNVHVARASDGQRVGWLVWGGNLGLRSLPLDVEDVTELRERVWDARPLLWLGDKRYLPGHVIAALEDMQDAPRPTEGGGGWG